MYPWHKNNGNEAEQKVSGIATGRKKVVLRIKLRDSVLKTPSDNKSYENLPPEIQKIIDPMVEKTMKEYERIVADEIDFAKD